MKPEKIDSCVGKDRTTECGSQMGFPLSIGEENSFHDNRQERETIQKLSLENGKPHSNERHIQNIFFTSIISLVTFLFNCEPLN